MSPTVYTSLRLQQFRSYTDFAVELSPTVNIVVGPNASGKTNLLESLLVLSGVSSYRAGYTDIIGREYDWARIDGTTPNGTRVVKLTHSADTVTRAYELNDTPKKRLGFQDIVPVVLFEPEHMRLLTGSPELRRDFFDDILAETEPGFSSIKSHYKRALAQRNRLLKQDSRMVHSQIFAWNIRVSELAGKIVAARTKLIEELNKQVATIYSEIAGEPTNVFLQYQSDIPLETYETSLLKKLESNLDKDLLRGFTAYGPHREDILVFIREQPADITASRGETRTLVLSLKLLELTILEQVRAQKPLILLDDVFSELDGARRKALTRYLSDYQTIITTTDADVVLKEFAQASNLISLG
ncbi:MAG: DNA replication and repair protein RecF [Candidatus Saccharimonadales bacterium]